MCFPSDAGIYGALYGAWWCEPPDGVQKWNPKSSSYLKLLKAWKYLILDCSIPTEYPKISELPLHERLLIWREIII